MDIAVIGMAGRFPDADTIDVFLENLKEGRSSIRSISSNRIKHSTLDPSQSFEVRGYLDQIDNFDHKLFNFSLAEAQNMDPHVRLMLETTYEAIENSGYTIDELKDREVSVYMPEPNLKYYLHAEKFDPTLVTGNSTEVASAWINRCFGFRGNSLTINTSCSSSLSAIYLACNDLKLGYNDVAVICGANIELFPYVNESSMIDNIDSKDGKSIAFSDNANGMVFGEGVACVLLKPLSKAIQDKDIIHGIIKSVAVNNNANRSASITAPDSLTQVEVIQKALKFANLAPEDIGFIEAHGSGTVIGDNIEIGGLSKVFANNSDRKIPISTVKSSIGHGRLASGLASFIKTILALKHEVLFPTPNFSNPSSLIDFDNSPVYVNTTLKPWLVEEGKKRVAGISSMGFSGTNGHLIAEEYKAFYSSEETKGKYYIFPFSSNTRHGLQENIQRFLSMDMKQKKIEDISYTLTKGRKHYPNRYAVVASSLEDLKIQLNQLKEEQLSSSSTSVDKMVYLFSDLSVSVSSIDFLKNHYPVFKNHYEECFALAKPSSVSDHHTAFAYQWAFYKLLQFNGLDTKYLLGLGLGKFVVSAINGECSLAESYKSIDAYRPAEMPDLENRTQKLIKRETSEGAVIFVSLGLNSVHEQIQLANAPLAKVVVVPQVFEYCPFLDLVKRIYSLNYSILWKEFQQNNEGRRTELPTYSFERKRCWIRESANIKDKSSKNSNTLSEDNILIEKGTLLEKKIALAWGNALSISCISLNDNFFSIGGDSIKATKVINSINKEFNLKLDFEDIFDFQKLNSFSNYVSSLLKIEDYLSFFWKDVLKLETVSLNDSFFELGGHSLIASQIINKIKQVYGIELDFDLFFEYPTILELSDYIRASKNAESTAIHIQKIPKLQPSDFYEISHNQQRLWILNQLDEKSVAYNEPFAVELEGSLNVHALQKSIEYLFERHEILRTNFLQVEGHPRQIIHPYLYHMDRLEKKDFSLEKNALELVNREINKDILDYFDLEKDCLIRLKLFKIEESRHVFYFNMHHIITDGWSFLIMLKELFVSYHAFSNSKRPNINPLNIQYKDYAAWYNELINSEKGLESKEFWLKQFEESIPVLDIDTDFNRSLQKSSIGYKSTSVFDRGYLDSIENLCKENGTSLFMFLLASVKLLMYKYSRQEDIVIGTPVASRFHVDLEDQLGFYANTIAIRTKFSASHSFEELLNNVKSVSSSAFKHEWYPFDLLINELIVERDLTRSPLFDVMVVFQNFIHTETNTGQLQDLHIKNYDYDVSLCKFDLTFVFYMSKKGMHLDLVAREDLFTSERVDRMLVDFRTILSRIVKNTHATLSEIVALTEDEKNKLLGFNQTVYPYPSEHTVIDLFEEKVAQNPDAIALLFGEKQISYKQLDEQANQLATYLIEHHSICSNDIIGISMERSEYLIVSILAILKTGAAYLPIEPSYPKDRISFILESSAAKLLIVDAKIRELSVSINQLEVLNESLNEFKMKVHKPERHSNASSLAYIIYTSGSTGNPKGVAVSNNNIVNYLVWANRYYFDDSKDFTLGFFTSFSFDLTITSILGTLLRGAKLVVYSSSEITGILYDMFKADTLINAVKLTPSHIDLLSEIGVENTNIEIAIVGGEALKESQVKALKRLNPSMRIYNEYGPTETSVGCVVKEVLQDDNRITIGKPISNMRIYILGKEKEVLPIGVSGEICISGEGVAQGYINNEALTSVKFIDNPYEDQGKMYLTGDIGKWLSNGEILYLGRLDDQVKIRGYRIELTEIENVLLNYKSVKEAIVLAKENSNSKYLVAYIVANDSYNESGLFHYMNQQLPHYMIPASFIRIKELPLTANGKIDKKTLLALTEVSATGEKVQSPRNETEEKMIEIWKEILGRENVNINDNIFSIGGHSLSVIKFINKVQSKIGIQLNIKDVFNYQTVQMLCDNVDFDFPEYNEIKPLPEMEYYELSHAQKRVWAISQMPDASLTFNMPMASLLEGELNLTAFHKAFELLLARHEILRTVFVLQEGLVKQKIKKQINVLPLEVINLKAVDNNLLELRKYIDQEWKIPFDLEEGPLFRIKIIELESGKNGFLFTAHHIITDDLSQRILLKEFIMIYNAWSKGYTVNLEPLKVQYKDFAAWQNSMFESASSNYLKSFWLSKLAGKLPVLDLPFDRERPAVMTFNGGVVNLNINESKSNRLKELTKESGTTLFMYMVAIIDLLLYKYSGLSDIVLGTPIANRQHDDLENQVGFYLNTLALRTTFDTQDSFDLLLLNVKKVCLEAYEHQLYPFDKIIEDLKIKRDASRHPLFDVMIDMIVNQDTVDANEMDGISIKSLSNSTVNSKFDLTIYVYENDKDINVTFNYNSDLFDVDTIELMSDNMLSIIENVIDDSKRSVEELVLENKVELSKINSIKRN